MAEEEGGLLVALGDLATMTTAAGTLCKFAFDPEVSIPDRAVAGHLYRIAQEAITNSLKHGKAQTIHISLRERNGQLELGIEDDGRGLAKDSPRKPGMGLKLIQHRARLIGGQISVHSKRGQGVRIVCSLPKLP
jgi:signal transduction histidine kinase